MAGHSLDPAELPVTCRRRESPPTEQADQRPPNSRGPADFLPDRQSGIPNTVIDFGTTTAAQVAAISS